MVNQDEAAKRLEIIDAMEQSFLQDLARAGANVPPRATVTTALLRGLLWDKREDELLTRGHTTIETQVVKSSRRSALLQLVSQVWKVPKPDYDKVDAMLATWIHNNSDSSAVSSNSDFVSPPTPIAHTTHTAPHSALTSLMNHSSHNNGAHASHGLTNHFSSRPRKTPSVPSSLGSSAEYDAYEALSQLSDAMMVDGPTNSTGGGVSSPSSASSSSSAANSSASMHKSTRDGFETQKEPIDSVTAVVFRSSPLLSSIKFNRSRTNLSSPQTHSEATAQQTTQHAPQTPSASPFPTLITSSNRFTKRHANSSSPTQSSISGGSISSSVPGTEPKFFERANRQSGGFSSPRSVASSPSSSTSTATDSSVAAMYGNGANGTTTPNSSSRSKFPLPLDLKSLMPHRSDLSNGSMGSPSSVASDDSAPPDSIHLASRSSSGSRSFPSALRISSSKIQPQGTPPSSTPNITLQPPILSPQPDPPVPTPTHSLSTSNLAAPSASVGVNQFAGAATNAPLDPRLLSAALTPPPDHVPVWVPRTNPPVPLVLCPVRGPTGDWFYSYQPISYADMTLLVAGAAAQAQAQAHMQPSSPFQNQNLSSQQPH